MLGTQQTAKMLGYVVCVVYEEPNSELSPQFT
jgi:hypothetical protein